MRLATLVRLITHSDCADGPTRLLHYRNIGSVSSNQYGSPQEQTRPHFTNMAVAAQVSVANLSMARDGDGSVSRYSRLSIYFSTNYVACKGGTAYGMVIVISIHQSLPDPPRAMISSKSPHYHDIPAMRRKLFQCASKFPIDGILLCCTPSRPVPDKWCHIHQMWTMAFVRPLGGGVSVVLLSHLSVL
jgi:hypothetical protein